MIVHHYQIESILGQGSFATVYKAYHLKTKQPVAIKMQQNNHLKYEAKIYQYLNSMKYPFAPQLKWFGTIQDYQYLAIELLHEPILNPVSIIHQLIDALQHLHRLSLLHRDIKPGNILLSKCGNVRLIDFGMAKRFEYNGQHMECQCIHNLIGSPNYVSLNVHQWIEPSRRDDLESALYVFLFFSHGLPWENELDKENAKQQFETPALTYVRQLAFTETPNYARLKQLLN